VIASCASASGRPGDVAGIAVAGQMAGVLGVGADGRAVTPYDSWLDSRCRAEVEMIAARLGDRLVELSGCPSMVAHAPKITWWRRHRPDTYGQVARFVVPGAFVAGRLCDLDATGAYIDTTYLHFSGLADTAHATWSPELATGSEVELDKLPRILAPTDMVGHLSAGRRPRLWPAARYPGGGRARRHGGRGSGAGIVAPGQLLDTAGTASVLALSTTAFRPDLSGTLVQMRGAVPGQWLALAYLAGGDLLRWLPEVLGAACLEDLIKEASDAGGAVVVRPHLGGRILPAAPRPGGRG